MNKRVVSKVPIIDIAPLILSEPQKKQVGEEINRACQEVGFFYIVNHGVSTQLQLNLEKVSQKFFSQPSETKMKIRMSLGGRAWRGYFPVGGELTSGKPDLKEGLYFGAELAKDAPPVLAGIPLHGPNLFPGGWPEFKKIVLEYMATLTQLGHTLMRGLSLSLKQKEDYFESLYTKSPTILFRIFHYPPPQGDSSSDPEWGVREHSDYGLLTILKQDDCGGLEVRSPTGWIKAPPLQNSFVCNIGDMLDKMTGGHYRSTPHRVLNQSRRSRFSYPFFFDPGFSSIINPIPVEYPLRDDKKQRWDGTSVHEFQGTYGDYLLRKVGRVFPSLEREVLKY